MFYTYDENKMFDSTSATETVRSTTMPPPSLLKGYSRLNDDNSWTLLYGVDAGGRICSDPADVVLIPSVPPEETNNVWNFTANAWLATAEPTAIPQTLSNQQLVGISEYTWKNGAISRHSYSILNPGVVAGLIQAENAEAASTFITPALTRSSLFGQDDVLNTLTCYVSSLTPAEQQANLDLLTANGIQSVSIQQLQPFYGKKFRLGDNTPYVKVSTLTHQSVPFSLPVGSTIIGEAYVIVDGVLDASIREVHFSLDGSVDAQGAISSWCETNNCMFSEEPFNPPYTSEMLHHYSVLFNATTHNILAFKQYVNPNTSYTYERLTSITPDLTPEELAIVVAAKQQLDELLTRHSIPPVALNLGA